MFRKILILLLLGTTIISCKKNDDEVQEIKVTEQRRQRDDLIIREYLAANNLQATKAPSGLYYNISSVGSGDILRSQDTVVSNYRVSIMYGKQVDNSYVTGRPYTLVMGDTKAIIGFAEAVSMLRPFGKGVFYLPSYLAYGAQGQGPVPPNSILIYEVEIAQVRRKKL